MGKPIQAHNFSFNIPSPTPEDVELLRSAAVARNRFTVIASHEGRELAVTSYIAAYELSEDGITVAMNDADFISLT